MHCYNSRNNVCNPTNAYIKIDITFNPSLKNLIFPILRTVIPQLKLKIKIKTFSHKLKMTTQSCNNLNYLNYIFKYTYSTITDILHLVN